MGFREVNSTLTIKSSFFFCNQALTGGVIYLEHTAGSVFLENNFFLENFAFIDDKSLREISSGGVIGYYCDFYALIYLEKNIFIRNWASKSGVIDGIYGVLFDYGSKFISKIWNFISHSNKLVNESRLMALISINMFGQTTLINSTFENNKIDRGSLLVGSFFSKIDLQTLIFNVWEVIIIKS